MNNGYLRLVWGIPLDPRNFHRKVTNTDGFIVPSGQTRSPEVGRPAALYRRGPAVILHPPMLRPDHDAVLAASDALRANGSEAR